MEFVDHIVQLTNHIALLWDQSGAEMGAREWASRSMSFAQHSYVLICQTTSDPRLAEERVLKTGLCHEQLSWAKGKGEEPDSFPIFMHRFTYDNSKVLALFRAYSTSIQQAKRGKSNALWSCYWSSLHLQRVSLQHCFQQAAGNEEAKEREAQLNQFARHAAAGYGSVLRENMSGLMAVGELDCTMQAWTENDQPLMKEFKWIADLLKFLESSSVFSVGSLELYKRGESYASL